ncbi:hypothetical protein HD806DRAFT_536031 [Xylariaceae sp. AK1471]|nr:hypothetical protein HD806DRAFT_536031 [Xylariaceae sp. AK1471]
MAVVQAIAPFSLEDLDKAVGHFLIGLPFWVEEKTVQGDLAFIVVKELPRNLYRVHYSESQTTLTDEGLEAADTTTFYGDSEREKGLFRQAVEDHFTWGYRGRSPFVSLFSDRNHAENWGCAEPWRGSNSHREQWTLYTIDTSLLEEIYVFKVSGLVDALGVRIPEKAKQHEQRSYICLHRVPAHAILEEKDGIDVRYCRENGEHWDPCLGYVGSKPHPASRQDIASQELINMIDALLI